MANATLTIHAAGWLEGGPAFGYEKFINDVEALQIIAELCVKPGGSDADIGYEALADVPPGGISLPPNTRWTGTPRHSMRRW